MIMTYDSWMKRTYVRTSARSDKLKAIDSALQGYYMMRHQSPQTAHDAVRKIYLRLREWMDSKGPDWKTSDRNKNHAIENLYDQVYAELFPDERRTRRSTPAADALEAVKQARREAAKRLFANTRLDLKGGYKKAFTKTELGFTASNTRTMYRDGVRLGMTDFAGEARAGVRTGIRDAQSGVATGARDAVDGARSLIGPGHALSASRGPVASAVSSATSSSLNFAHNMIQDVVRLHVDASTIPEVLSYLHMSGAFTDFVAEAVGSVIPVAGVVGTGASALAGWAQAARDIWRRYELATDLDVILPGDAIAAVAAMERIIERSLDANTQMAKIKTLQFGTQALLQALDVTGTAPAIVGAVGAFASLSQRIYLIGRDFLERRRANKALAVPESIDLRIFETHPILGCYLLVFSETSSLIDALGNFGGAGWQGEVEWMKTTHLDPLRERALAFIRDSRFHLVSTKDGQLERRFLIEKMAFKSKLKKTGPMSPAEFATRYGRQLPSDFRQRIVGQGPTAA